MYVSSRIPINKNELFSVYKQRQSLSEDDNHNHNRPNSAPAHRLTFSNSLFRESTSTTTANYEVNGQDSSDSSDDSDLVFISSTTNKKPPEKSPPKKKRKTQASTRVVAELKSWAKAVDGTETIDTYEGRKDAEFPPDMKVVQMMMDSTALVKSMTSGTKAVNPEKWAKALSALTTQFMEKFPSDKPMAAVVHSMTELPDNFGRLAACARESALVYADRTEKKDNRKVLPAKGNLAILLMMGYLYNASTPRRLQEVTMRIESLMRIAESVQEAMHHVDKEMAGNMRMSLLKAAKGLFRMYLSLDQRYADDMQLVALSQCYAAAPHKHQHELPQAINKAFDQIAKEGKTSLLTLTGMLRATRKDGIVLNDYDTMKVPYTISQRKKTVGKGDRKTENGTQSQNKGADGKQKGRSPGG